MPNENENPFAGMTNEEIIDLYLEDILSTVGLDESPEDEKKDFKSKLRTELEARVGIVVMNAIPDDKVQEFTDMMQKNPTQEEINAFVSKNVSNLEEIIVKAMQDFKEEFVSEFQKNLESQLNENNTDNKNDNTIE